MSQAKKRKYPAKTMTPREKLKSFGFYLAPVKFTSEVAEHMIAEMENAEFGAGVSQVVNKRMLDSYKRESKAKTKK